VARGGARTVAPSGPTCWESQYARSRSTRPATSGSESVDGVQMGHPWQRPAAKTTAASAAAPGPKIRGRGPVAAAAATPAPKARSATSTAFHQAIRWQANPNVTATGPMRRARLAREAVGTRDEARSASAGPRNRRGRKVAAAAPVTPFCRSHAQREPASALPGRSERRKSPSSLARKPRLWVSRRTMGSEENAAKARRARPASAQPRHGRFPSIIPAARATRSAPPSQARPSRGCSARNSQAPMWSGKNSAKYAPRTVAAPAPPQARHGRDAGRERRRKAAARSAPRPTPARSGASSRTLTHRLRPPMTPAAANQRTAAVPPPGRIPARSGRRLANWRDRTSPRSSGSPGRKDPAKG